MSQSGGVRLRGLKGESKPVDIVDTESTAIVHHYVALIWWKWVRMMNVILVSKAMLHI